MKRPHLPWLIGFALAVSVCLMASFGYYFREDEGLLAWVVAAVCGVGVVVAFLRREAHRRSRQYSDASRQAMGLLTWSYRGTKLPVKTHAAIDESSRAVFSLIVRVVTVALAGGGLVTGAQHCPGYQNEGYIWTAGSVVLFVAGWSVAGWWARREPDPILRGLKRSLALAKDDDVTFTAAGLVLGYRARAWSGTQCRLVGAGQIWEPVRALTLEFKHWRLFRESLILPLPNHIGDFAAQSLVTMLADKIQGRRVDWEKVGSKAPSPK